MTILWSKSLIEVGVRSGRLNVFVMSYSWNQCGLRFGARFASVRLYTKLDMLCGSWELNNNINYPDIALRISEFK